MKIDFCGEWSCKRIGTDTAYPVTLPHDAMISERRTKESKGGKNTGWYEGGDYIYEKKFTVLQIGRGQVVFFEFEGVYKDAEIRIGGRLAGTHQYGYTGFLIDGSEFLTDGENTIQVTVHNSDQPNSRWYTGTGIYRPVYLHIVPEAHILPAGIRVKTVSWENKEIEIAIETSHRGTIKLEVLDGEVCLLSKETEVDQKTSVGMALPAAELWSCDNPKLYTLRASFGDDIREEVFGIRGLSVNSREGLRINGKRVILRGCCIHHDNGILGACAYASAEERKVRLLKAAGYNALRSAHNPCSKALLDACDREGVLVMDEYTDMWYIHKTKYDYAGYVGSNYETDLKAMVDKDYNHPSVVMYSTGNEVAETGQKKGIELCRRMTEYLHSLDDSRPVTCGINIFFNYLYSLGFGVYTDEKADSASGKEVGSAFYNKLAMLFGSSTMKFGATLHGSDRKTKDAYANMDVAGYNYGIWRYRKDFKKYPDRVIVGSETFCADAWRFWETAKENPALIGDFVWAGMDYLGEVGGDAWDAADYTTDKAPGPGWTGTGGGRVNLIGSEIAEAAYTRVAFELDPIHIGVIPVHRAKEARIPSAWKLTNAVESWSWNGCEGKQTWVEVYARAYEVSLSVNGTNVGRKRVKKGCRTVFKVVYRAGEVKAEAYDRTGKMIAETTLKTAGNETKLTIAPEEPSGGLHYIKLQYTDANGKVKPLERGDIRVRVEGGTILGLGSAAPYTEYGYQSDVTGTYFGEALLVVRPDGDDPVLVTAESPHGNGTVLLNKKSKGGSR